MKKFLSCCILFLSLGVQAPAQELFTELQANLTADGPLYTFRILGDKESGAFSAYGIHVIAPNGDEHMLDQFDALLPEGSEPDALFVEDVNFDGYNDLRIMKYLPGGANVPYYFWLYNPQSQKFEEAKSFEIILSPEVNLSEKTLISRQRVNAAEYVTEFYTVQGNQPTVNRREERTYSSDGSSTLKVIKVHPDGREEVLETKNLGPEG